MPSGEIVEIDAADNDVAILDASACALASLSSSSSSPSDAAGPTVSQSQEDHHRGGGGGGVGGGEGQDEEDEDDGGGVDGGADDRRGLLAQQVQVSPVPQKKASVVTPRSARSGRAPTKKSSTGGKARVGKSSSSSSSSSAAAKGKRKGKDDVDVDVDGEGGPATPSSSSSSAVVVAVATPGEDDGVTTKKRKDGTSVAAAVTVVKKPSTTLHSFFARVDPSVAAAERESGVKRPTIAKGGPARRVVVASSSSSSSSAAVPPAAVDGGGEGSRAHDEAVEGVPAKATTDDEVVVDKGKKAVGKKKPAAPGKGRNDKKTSKKAEAAREKKSAIEETLNVEKNDEVKEEKTKGSSSMGTGGVEKTKKDDEDDDDATRLRHAPSSSSRVGNAEDELDDSPTYALAVASRTIGARGSSRRGNNNNGGGALARQWDVRYDLLVRYKLTHGDCSMPFSYKTTADGEDGEGKTQILLGRWLENQKVAHKRSKLLPERYERLRMLGVDFGERAKSIDVEIEVDSETIDDIVDPVLEAVDTVELDDGEAVGGTSMTGANDKHANEVSDDIVIDIYCEGGKDSALENTAPVSLNKLHEDDDDDDATVVFEEAGDASGKSIVASNNRVDEDSHLPTEIDQPPNTSDDLMDNQEIPIEDDEAVLIVGTSTKSVLKEPLTETTVVGASNNEVTKVAALKVTVKKSAHQVEMSTKLSTKSRKKANASPKKSSKEKALAAATETKGVSPIAASLKKLAACPQTKVCKTKKQESPSATASDFLGAINDSTSSNNLIDTKEDTVSSSTTPSIVNLSEEDASRLRDYTILRAKYVLRAIELGNLPSSDDYEEECLSLEGCTVNEGSVEVAEDGGFPDKLLTHLQLLVQGRSQPLSVITKYAFEELSPFITDVRPLTFESISSKIKLLAQRKSYLSGKPPASEKANPVAKLDCFENAEECYMWRWELSSLDLLPQKEAIKVKKARTLRKKLQGHHKAIINLIITIDKASLWLQNSASMSIPASAPAVGETLTAKVSDMEEKVLKFEREEEKARLLRESKLHIKNKTEDLAEKQREKQRLEEEKRNEKKRLEEEKRNEKKRKEEEKELKKAEETRLKNEEKEKKRQDLEEKENKRKARMMSFFSQGSVKKKAKVLNACVLSNSVRADIPLFDSDAFHKLIDSRDDHVVTNPFAKLSPRSKASRRWKTNKVRISVFVTVLSENAFAPQPYDEERVITVPNRYKFLGFHEDVRPPYRGTWSKRSSLVTGRRPLGKDTKFLDYDNDSEEEWEEGDDEEGEDLVDDDDGADEEEDMQNDEDNDGWLADEDDLGIEDDDDETRELRKKNLSNNANGPSGKPSHFKACVVAPLIGGLPHERFEDDDIQCLIEGFSPQEAMDVLTSHAGCVVTPDVSICLDAFPPSDSMKDANQTKKDSSGKSSTPQIKDLTPEAQKLMAHFVHNSTLKSKDHVVTELLKAHPTITNSRAQAMRELDAIADKRRLANGPGVLWEVKIDHLTKLGLKEEDLKKAPEEAPPSKLSEGGDKTKKKKDPNAPKQNMSAFLLYCIATRNDFRAANPDLVFGDVTKLLSANFKALTAEERAAWDDKAATDKARYHKEMAEYSSKVASPESKVAVASCSPKPSVSHTTKSSSAKKHKVSTASANLLAAFMSKKKQKLGS